MVLALIYNFKVVSILFLDHWRSVTKVVIYAL